MINELNLSAIFHFSTSCFRANISSALPLPLLKHCFPSPISDSNVLKLPNDPSIKKYLYYLQNMTQSRDISVFPRVVNIFLSHTGIINPVRQTSGIISSIVQVYNNHLVHMPHRITYIEIVGNGRHFEKLGDVGVRATNN